MTDRLPIIRPGRRITGMAAVLLPFTEGGDVDWLGFTTQLEKITAAGLTPAVNMDTGYVALLDTGTRAKVLEVTRSTGVEFVGGVYVDEVDEYQRGIDHVVAAGGLPILFPSHGQAALAEDELLDMMASIGERTDRFLAFELGTMFLPHGWILSLAGFEALLGISSCVGAKHSSLDRTLEWDRLAVRDRVRPDFLVLTGNDLAIDMVMYGSDYLLGLAAFAPDVFGRRDALWEAGDRRFYAVNDVLQYLGNFAFRPPVPAYRHDAAMFLRKRGWIATDHTHPDSPRRADADSDVLDAILASLESLET